jgi:hypothetical protein
MALIWEMEYSARGSACRVMKSRHEARETPDPMLDRDAALRRHNSAESEPFQDGAL